MTSSTSLISFRLEEVSKALTTGRGRAYWFMFEPLLMSKTIFDGLPKEQQNAIMAAGAEQEKFALESAKPTTGWWRMSTRRLAPRSTTSTSRR